MADRNDHPVREAAFEELRRTSCDRFALRGRVRVAGTDNRLAQPERLHELRLEFEVQPGRCLDVDLDNPCQPGTFKEPLDLRPRQAVFLCDVLLRPPVDVRPVCNPGKQLVVIRGQVVGQRRDLATG